MEHHLGLETLVASHQPRPGRRRKPSSWRRRRSTFADGHSKIFYDPDNEINPKRDKTGEYLEFWDPRQRTDLYP